MYTITLTWTGNQKLTYQNIYISLWRTGIVLLKGDWLGSKPKFESVIFKPLISNQKVGLVECISYEDMKDLGFKLLKIKKCSTWKLLTSLKWTSLVFGSSQPKVICNLHRWCHVTTFDLHKIPHSLVQLKVRFADMKKIESFFIVGEVQPPYI